ncbi:MAG: restriction endonuclease, partial [Aquificaceae bacterium]
MDKNPGKSFEEIRDLDLDIWRKILENDTLWDEGVLKALFPTGKALEKLAEHLKSKDQNLAGKLRDRIKNYYP